ncbi:LPS-assembly protein LptD [Marinilongibacter aquaticus]|uniref:putative LPS assembly protein LptD n=1 Tax=Marinilongibacter aquaticus TaxID=2975157 RepID=UPI0021BDA55D|nr:putative LPS assembly protein LptD [Marinilongibacter aquaticus]UBM58063.1 LPS-assembly protein LptD [Marinilongibacter aquaticus]
MVIFFCLFLGLFGLSVPSFAQFKRGGVPKPKVDNRVQLDSARTDTLKPVVPDSLRSAESDLETTVVYTADSINMDMPNKTIYLFDQAEVTYGDISLKADFIQLSWEKSEVYAYGMPDTTVEVGEQVRGKPVFTQGQDVYNTDTIRYNFESRKALIKRIITEEGEGIIHGEKVKKDPKDNLYLVDAKYTTCNMAEPHFHIAARKIKLVEKKSVISGPFNFVLADVPLPIGLPFGFFPVPKKKEIGTSGFIMGTYGEEPRNRGFYFRDFGYYHAFSEYIGAKVLAQIYSRGSWGVALQSQYTKRYKFSGNVNMQFNFNKPGDELSLQAPSKDFSISWSHSPQNKRPDRSFSASVNLVSNSFNQNNRRLDEVNQYTNNTFGSSIQYGKNFGKLVRTSTSLRVDQNVTTKVLNGSANYSIGVNQFNPFVPEKKRVGNWYESFRVGLNVQGGYKLTNATPSRSTSYTDYNVAGVSNNPLSNTEQQRILELQNYLSQPGLSSEERSVYQKELDALTSPVLTDFQAILDQGEFTTSYSVPIALPNFKIAKFLNLTPGVSYRGDLYTKQLNYKFLSPAEGSEEVFTKGNGKTVTVRNDASTETISNSYDELGNLLVVLPDSSGGVVVVDTINTPSFASNYSFNAGLNTRIYGTFRGFGKKSRLQAIRHTLSPSISWSYTPATENSYVSRVQVRDEVDTTGALSSYKYLPKFVNGPSSGGSAASSISFSLSNQLEAKFRSKSDTASEEFEKVMLLNNFNISGSYNLLAGKDKTVTQYALSNINMNANTSLFKGLINLNAGGTFDPYAYISDPSGEVSGNLAGIRVPIFKWQKGKYSGSGGNYLSRFNVAVSTRFSPETFNKGKKTEEVDEEQDPALAAMQKFVKANPMAYVDFSVPWSLNLSYNLNYTKQGLSDPRVVQALQIRGDLSITSKLKVTYSTGWDFVFKRVTLTNIGLMRELHCWDMSFNWTPIAGNSRRSSNYSFDLRVRSSLLSDLKISRRRVYYDRGGF